MKVSYSFIQALRGVAALWVVLFHAMKGEHIEALYAALPGWLAASVFDAGHLGVAIFFTLSGFVIAHSLDGKEMTVPGWGHFMLRRSIRLDPTYWASLTVVIALGLLSASLKGEAVSGPGVDSILAHVAYLQIILGFPQIDVVYWTLAYEVQFYAVFALAMMIPRYRLLLFGLAVPAAAGLFSGLHEGIFLVYWAAFFVGAVARFAVSDLKWLAGLLPLCGVLGWSGEFGVANAVTAVFLWAGAYSAWGVNGLNFRWLQHLGAISYSLYLFHNPTISAVGVITRRVLGQGVVADIIELGVMIAICIAVAHLVWLCIERPSQRLSKRIGVTRDVDLKAASLTA